MICNSSRSTASSKNITFADPEFKYNNINTKMSH